MKSALFFTLLGINASVGLVTAGLLIACSKHNGNYAAAWLVKVWAFLSAAVPTALIWIIMHVRR